MGYLARVLSEIEYSPHSWKGLKVGVFKVEGDIEIQIGEYERNYSNLHNTFFHFQKDGKDFALYSPDYTVTRIMELPACKDIGGEDPNLGGFCPVDYFVPTYVEQETSWETVSSGKRIGGDVSRRRVNNPEEKNLTEHIESQEFIHQTTKELCNIRTITKPLTPLNYYHFGFVSGCVWGDDSSWKIQYLDLSQAGEGKIVRDARFGYIELPPKMGLKEAMVIEGSVNDSGDYRIRVQAQTIQTFDLKTGNVVDPFE